LGAKPSAQIIPFQIFPDIGQDLSSDFFISAFGAGIGNPWHNKLQKRTL
jgi:hypothetical protein